MGYNLSIGQAYVEIDTEYSFASIEVKGERFYDAPAFGEPTDYINERWPSYSAWGDFCRNTGLNDLFFNEDDGLMREHPFVCPLEQKHLDKIKESEFITDLKTYDKNRLTWLIYWMEFALKNCDKPVFKNT